MYYLFNSNGECVITAQSPIEPINGYTHVESDEVYNPWEVRLIDGAITKQEPPKEEPKEEPTEDNPKLTPSIEELSDSVAGLYELLANVIPPTEEESEGEHE